MNFAKFLRTPFLTETPPVAASDLSIKNFEKEMHGLFDRDIVKETSLENQKQAPGAFCKESVF